MPSPWHPSHWQRQTSGGQLALRLGARRDAQETATCAPVNRKETSWSPSRLFCLRRQNSDPHMNPCQNPTLSPPQCLKKNTEEQIPEFSLSQRQTNCSPPGSSRRCQIQELLKTKPRLQESGGPIWNRWGCHCSLMVFAPWKTSQRGLSFPPWDQPFISLIKGCPSTWRSPMWTNGPPPPCGPLTAAALHSGINYIPNICPPQTHNPKGVCGMDTNTLTLKPSQWLITRNSLQ